MSLITCCTLTGCTPTLFCAFSSVKYMREATPYVKKGSPVSEIGWETPPPESPRLGSPAFPPSSSSSSPDAPSSPVQASLSPQGDRRCIPLKMCYVTRAMTTPDPENRWVRCGAPPSFHVYHEPNSRAEK